MSESTYEILGHMDFEDADGANIPVNIFLHRFIDSDGNTTQKWELDADNFMPRKGLCAENVYNFTSEDRELLVSLVQKHWRPLYEKALEKLALVPDGREEACLYYWK